MPDARIGITNAEIAGILEDVDAFVERYGYRPDLEQFILCRIRMRVSTPIF